MSVRKQVLIDVFLTTKSSDAVNACITLIQSRFGTVFNKQSRRKLYNSLQRVKSKFQHFHDVCCHRMTDRFYDHHKRWLNIDYKVPGTVPVPDNAPPDASNASNKPAVNPGGRPKLSYEAQSKRSKRRTIREVSKVFDRNTNLALDTARYVAARNGDSKVVSALASGKDTQNIENTQNEKSSIMTPDAALALFLECELTKEQYRKIRNAAIVHGHNFLPSYKKILEAKKACRPKNVVVHETEASVPLQDLVDHTVIRIIQSQHNFIERQLTSADRREVNGKMIICWGFDGTSQQSQFNQGFSTVSDHHETSLFVTSTLPLKLVCDNNVILWANAIPQSVKFCRPKSVKFEKESGDLTRRTKAEFEEEIRNLKPTSYNFNNKTLTVECDFFLTMLDGKCLMNISDVKSSSVCYICGCPPTKMNDLQQARSFKLNEDMLSKGFSVLHLWMRILDAVTKISYKLEVKDQIRGEDMKRLVAARKKEIQDRFWNQLHLRLDLPRASGGTSSTGNVARRAFEDPCKLAKILELNEELIVNLQTILVSLACQLPLNIEKFEKLCDETAELYVSKYNWKPMTPTLHKVLIHGGDILRQMPLPAGQMSEEAAEARNKFIREYRSRHARRSSRVNNLEDVFNRLLDSSDPMISSIYLEDRLRKKTHKKLPDRVQDILLQLDSDYSSNDDLVEVDPMEEFEELIDKVEWLGSSDEDDCDD